MWANAFARRSESDCMATVEELVVRAKPDGVNDTTRQFENMGDELEETEESMSGATDEFGAMANKWKGALGAIVAGLAVAIGGVLSQVPVLKEVMSGFGAVVESVGFQIDKQLRPALQPLVSDLFDLSGAIAAGDWKEFDQIIGGWAQAIGEFSLNDLLMDISGFVSDVSEELQKVDFRKQINNLLNGIGEALSGVQWGEFATEITTAIADFFLSVDWLGITADIIKFFGTALANGIRNANWMDFLTMGGLLTALTALMREEIKDTDWSQLAKDIATGIGSALMDAAKFIAGGFEDIFFGTDEKKGLIDKAIDWGVDLIEGLIKGIENAADWLRDKVNQIVDDIIDKFSIDFDVNRTESGFVIQAGGATNVGGNNGGTGSNGASPNVSVNVGGRRIVMDGRDLTDTNGRYYNDQHLRRGNDYN